MGCATHSIPMHLNELIAQLQQPVRQPCDEATLTEVFTRAGWWIYMINVSVGTVSLHQILRKLTKVQFYETHHDNLTVEVAIDEPE